MAPVSALDVHLEAGTLLGKVGAFLEMASLAHGALFAIPTNCKVAADPRLGSDSNVRVEASRSFIAFASAVESNTERRSFGCRLVGEGASVGRVWALFQKKKWAQGNLCWVVLIFAGHSPSAHTYKRDGRE